VYLGTYEMSIGTMGIVFLVILISSIVGFFVYSAALYWHYEPYTIKNGIGVPEHRLLPGVFAAALLPAGLFLFGWTARESIAWPVPTIGILIYGFCAFVVSL
jgi:MFS transporter, DHA1 family, multidrug resistance protein